MPIPDYQSLMLPFLELLGDGRARSSTELREALAARFRLSEAELRELLPSGRQPIFHNRVGWTKTYLDKAGLVSSVRRGVYQLTKEGRKLLDSKPESLSSKSLEAYESFRRFRERTQGDDDVGEAGDADAGAGAGGDAATPAGGGVGRGVRQSAVTPLEQLEAGYSQLRRELEEALLAAVSQASPSFFERLVVDLLVAMGYGGTTRDAGSALGGAGDGGIDGVIKEDPLGLDAVYIQAKRWQTTVGRPTVQAFAGSLDGVRARKGVLITTSDFSKEARDYVGRIDKRIVLVDGSQLAALMFEHGIGVANVQSFHVKRMDGDYFNEE